MVVTYNPCQSICLTDLETLVGRLPRMVWRILSGRKVRVCLNLMISLMVERTDWNHLTGSRTVRITLAWGWSLARS